uniref:Major facilitator superfamily (MFS) profile domain-containing protein n=1 Tax=Ditylenchus dipsaci TaxID=166011 RepID=A0A915EKI2_9BILA
MDGPHHKSAVAPDENRLEVSTPMLARDELDNLHDLTPDQVLSIFGSTNLYLLFIWAAMANVWCLTAFPIMVSAFIMGEPCVIVNSTLPKAKCHPAEGTLAKEFNLTTDNSAIQQHFPTFIADLKGRQPVLVWCLFAQSLLGCLSAFAPNIYLFILSRFLQGVCTNGSGSTPWVLAYESVPLKLRSYTAMVFGLFWVVGYCSLGPMAYFVRDWRHLIIVGTSPMLLFSVLYYLTIPESLHYLVSRGKQKHVARWLTKANTFATLTGSAKMTDYQVEHFSQNICEKLAQKTMKENQLGRASKYGLFHELLTNRRLLLYTLVLVYLWTCDNFVYYGLSLFSTQLAGNRYINFMLMGAVEIPSYLVSPALLDRLGRRTFVSLCHLLAAVSFFTILFTDNNPGVSLSMWLLGKFAISCAFTCLFVYASEVFPTVSRNGCIGICSVVGNLGGVFAPTVRSMSLISPMLPLLFFGVSAAMGGLLTLLLPEL